MNEEKFLTLCEDVAGMKSKLDNFINYVNEDVSEKSNDHETRLRVVEEWKSKVIGAVAAAGIIGGVIGGLIQFLAGRI